MAVFYRGDAVEMMKRHIPTASVDLLYADPPFDGATQNSWDRVIDWPAFFAEAFRVLKPAGTLILHCSVPFNYTLIRAAPRPPSHSWYWKKGKGITNPFIAKVQPTRNTEEILVWRNKKTTYYPQRVGEEVRTFRSQGVSGAYGGTSQYYGATSKQPLQTVKGKFQTHFVDMEREIDGFSTRPKALIKLMIDSYSKEGNTILDCFCYNGISSTCCPGRKWIGIDLLHVPKYLVSPPT